MKILKYLLALCLALIFVGCQEDNSSNTKLANQQEAIMQEANRQVGMPAIINFQERKMMKMIFELRDQEKLITYAYLVPENTGKLVFIGKCLGFGLPYATQFTNPETATYRGNYVWTTLPQADPNGLFMPTSAEGTWLLMLDKEGNPHPVYIEPRVIVSPFPLETK